MLAARSPVVVEEPFRGIVAIGNLGDLTAQIDVFIADLRTFGSISPGEAIAIGDTPYDVQAAKKIDLPIIGLLCGGFSEEALRDEGACAIFRDPADLLERYYQSPLAG